MIKIKYYFKFSDNSIAYLEDCKWIGYKPTHRYTSQILGMGKWVEY